MERNYERLEQAMEIYEEVRLAMARLRELEVDLDAREFQQFDVSVRAKEHLSLALQELNSLAEIMQALHMRPAEDSSEDVLDS